MQDFKSGSRALRFFQQVSPAFAGRFAPWQSRAAALMAESLDAGGSKMRHAALLPMKAIVVALVSMGVVMGTEAFARKADVAVLFAAAERDNRVGLAKKTKPVDARAAKPGEVVVTKIKCEGTETQSPPAQAGDMVVRNRCEATGNEEQLVKSAKFAERYDGPLSDDPAPGDKSAGWEAYRPRGNVMKFFRVREEDGSFTFTAPWGEDMVAKPGDVIVRDVADEKDTYRIARAAFDCTYEVVG